MSNKYYMRFISDTKGASFEEKGHMTMSEGKQKAKDLAKEKNCCVRFFAFNEKLRRWELLREFSPLGEMRDLWSY